MRDKPSIEEIGTYYRFNVVDGLEYVSLEDSLQKKAIVAATGRYLESHAVRGQLKQYVAALCSDVAWPVKGPVTNPNAAVLPPKLAEAS